MEDLLILVILYRFYAVIIYEWFKFNHIIFIVLSDF
jgi:hypothetical protein